jgi:hypothetical protein
MFTYFSFSPIPSKRNPTSARLNKNYEMQALGTAERRFSSQSEDLH